MSISSELLSELRDFAEELADAAATAIMPHFRTPISIEDKGSGSFDPVTIADKAAERIMREMIIGRFPDPPFVSDAGKMLFFSRSTGELLAPRELGMA